MNPIRENQLLVNRPPFLRAYGHRHRVAALGSMLIPACSRDSPRPSATAIFPASRTSRQAKRVIYLFMAGGPSQIDLFDHKPTLDKLHNTSCPTPSAWGAHHRHDQRAEEFPVREDALQILAARQMRHLFSELIPNIAGIADDIAVIKTVNTEAINHDRPSRSSRLDSSSRAGLAPARG